MLSWNSIRSLTSCFVSEDFTAQFLLSPCGNSIGVVGGGVFGWLADGMANTRSPWTDILPCGAMSQQNHGPLCVLHTHTSSWFSRLPAKSVLLTLDVQPGNAGTVRDRVHVILWLCGSKDSGKLCPQLIHGRLITVLILTPWASL